VMRRSRHTQSGFSLLELLIALLVFSVGLLAVAGLQTVSKQANFEAIQRSTAAQVANGLLEDIRTNGDAIDIYAAAGEMGGGSRGSEPAPNCRNASECNSAQKAAHDLWFWEQAIDGTLETNAGVAAGGLLLPTMCVTGPAGGGAGIYEVAIVWRGGADLVNSANVACGTLTGNYGGGNEFRRVLQVSTYVDPTM
jgi:type IV pilus assembly protein PilV